MTRLASKQAYLTTIADEEELKYLHQNVSISPI